MAVSIHMPSGNINILPEITNSYTQWQYNPRNINLYAQWLPQDRCNRGAYTRPAAIHVQSVNMQICLAMIITQ